MYSGPVARVAVSVASARNEGMSAGSRATTRPAAGRFDRPSSLWRRTDRPSGAVAARAQQTPASHATPGFDDAHPRRAFGLPNLRRNVCPHFYMTGTRGAIPIQAPHLLKALIRQDANVSRCQLRGGVHLEQGYVNDVCLTPRFNQCVFYEDELTRE